MYKQWTQRTEDNIGSGDLWGADSPEMSAYFFIFFNFLQGTKSLMKPFSIFFFFQTRVKCACRRMNRFPDQRMSHHLKSPTGNTCFGFPLKRFGVTLTTLWGHKLTNSYKGLRSPLPSKVFTNPTGIFFLNPYLQRRVLTVILLK